MPVTASLASNAALATAPRGSSCGLRVGNSGDPGVQGAELRLPRIGRLWAERNDVCLAPCTEKTVHLGFFDADHTSPSITRPMYVMRLP